MKKYILFIIGFFFITLGYSQSNFHNYFSQASGDYVQVGYGKGYILFRYPSPNNQFVRLEYLSSKDGMNYYGGNNFQVVIANNSSRVCVCTAQYSNWYNYCGPVPIPYPYSKGQNGRSSATTSSKCPWCNGSGRISKNEHVVQYGLNDYDLYVKCNECGETYNRTYRNHYHLNCGHCGGTGRLSN